jgi:hypothetical protein
LDDTIEVLPSKDGFAPRAVTSPRRIEPTSPRREPAQKDSNATESKKNEPKPLEKEATQIKKEVLLQEHDKKVNLREPSPKRLENVPATTHAGMKDIHKPSKPIKIARKPFVPTQKPDPIMSSFGIGNTNPSVPSNSLKTFNARAPLDQVFASKSDL